MDWDMVLLSRIQFGLTVSFHIIFPSFTIGFAAWLAVLEGRWLMTGHPYFRQLFDFWLKVFGIWFGMGVVSGIVMAFQFRANWSVLAERAALFVIPVIVIYTAFVYWIVRGKVRAEVLDD
jgi:cytochrome bd ubiquinol oxidase subunit I